MHKKMETEFVLINHQQWSQVRSFRKTTIHWFIAVQEIPTYRKRKEERNARDVYN